MASKTKQLKIIEIQKTTNKSIDTEDAFFDGKINQINQSNEYHFGHYIMSTLSDGDKKRNLNPRIYLYKWGINQSSVGESFICGTQKIKRLNYFITNKKWKYYKLARNFLDSYFTERKSHRLTQYIINGLRLFLHFLEKNKYECLNIESIDKDIYTRMYNYLSIIDSTKASHTRYVSEFFNAISLINNKKIRVNTYTKRNKIVALPSSIIYQLNIYAIQEIKLVIDALGNMEKSPTTGEQMTSNHYLYKDLNHKEILERSCFTSHCMYPFILYFMINYGLNFEALKNWKVKKTLQKDYELSADDIGPFIIIESIKNRSNDVITSVISKKSMDWKYINFLLKHLEVIYDESENNSLFQYYYCHGAHQVKQITSSFLSNICLSKYDYSFYNKYKIYNSSGKRLKGINHTLLRKSHNYQEFLRGKTEFERQLKKSHKSGNTTKIHYESQNHEWKEYKHHKIALAQNLVVGIFRGEITREDHKSANLFNGPMADCKDNKHPTFSNAQNLKENEYCSDWSKCLTQCDKSCVIPKIHGPIISAWINYLEQQKEDFLRVQDWEKEYLIDYQAAKDTFKRFTEEEMEYCNQISYKYDNFVSIKFSRTSKIKGNKYA